METYLTRPISVHPGPQHGLRCMYFVGLCFAKGQAKRVLVEAVRVGLDVDVFRR